MAFLLIGGYAVISHGYERTTSDMDIWLKPTNENRDQFIAALREHGVVDEKLNAVKKMDLNKPQVLAIGKKLNQVEFLTVVTGHDFEESDKEKKLTLLLSTIFVENHYPSDFQANICNAFLIIES